MNTDIDEDIFEYLYSHLNPKRLEHSYNVANLAVSLAERNDVNALNAWLAGLLHDCAKSMTDKELIKFLKNRKKKFKYFKEVSIKSPHLLHSFAGEIIAREYFKIKNETVLKAIKNHTLGRENMSILERLIFVADSISHDRKWKHAGTLRELAKEDLNKAFFEVLAEKISYVIRGAGWLCPQTIDTWNWYVSNFKKDS
ncbi:MAG: bis(5'-nucleosyl)-tetraphosphatase (symmetrical) YqeK [Endomicrobium sp.]|jgi:predicted HD superfamily hydrolase involved in NAD metabolism|nr:bis(5'-nucleosyl)-tetraphosphatase (symmetrical) YqeK [Endomicrobium sp.]